jgi:two-component system nitrate/nitrite response regulator NarL
MTPTVVIVDDDPLFRRTARMLLTARGAEVVAEAGDCASGLSTVMATSPDAALVDMQLPDGDGITLSHALAEQGLRVIVVLTSASDLDVNDDQLRDAAAVAFVPKERLVEVDLLSLLSPAGI